MRNFINKYINPIVPTYAIIPLLTCFGFNTLVYFGVKVINAGRTYHDFTTGFDNGVPLIKEFIIIYFGCYLFWAANYILIGRMGKEHLMRFVFADMMSRVICGIMFLVIPTTNIRPEITGTGITDELMRYLYQIDTAENLFPSIHCLVSWFCYIGIRGQKKVPAGYRAFSCVFALVVCASTQFTKQHYVIDIFGGLIIAELTYFISRRVNGYRILERIFDKIALLIFGNYCIAEREQINGKK